MGGELLCGLTCYRSRPLPPIIEPDLVTAHDREDRQSGVGEGSSNQAASSGALQLRLLEGSR